MRSYTRGLATLPAGHAVVATRVSARKRTIRRRIATDHTAVRATINRERCPARPGGHLPRPPGRAPLHAPSPPRPLAAQLAGTATSPEPALTAVPASSSTRNPP